MDRMLSVNIFRAKWKDSTIVILIICISLTLAQNCVAVCLPKSLQNTYLELQNSHYMRAIIHERKAFRYSTCMSNVPPFDFIVVKSSSFCESGILISLFYFSSSNLNPHSGTKNKQTLQHHQMHILPTSGAGT